MDRSRMIHSVLKLRKRVVFYKIEVGRGFNLIGKNNNNAHPRGTRLFHESIYPHIISGNRPSYPNHLSRVLVGMLVQLTKGCVNELIACLGGPAEGTATQGKNRNARTRQNQLHFGCSCCCCCFGGCI